MKKVLVLLTLIVGLPIFSQNAIYTDNDGDGIIEYVLKNSNGRVEETGFYSNGKMTGVWTSYYESGQRKVVARFKNGVKHGTWLIYDSKGRVSTEIVYKEDRKVSATQHKYAVN
jgi:antitoxin component YwqK of YwqJK toxin-antitoxin module